MHKQRAKIENHRGFVRDNSIGAILNTNKQEILHFQEIRAKEERLNTIEKELSEMKKLIEQLISMEK